MEKVINDVSLDTITKLVTTVYKNVKTDVSFKEALSYVNYLPNLSIDNINMNNTLPGEPKHQEKWFFIVDDAAIDPFVDEKILGIPSIGTPRTKIYVVSGDGNNESYETNTYSNDNVTVEQTDDDYNQELIDQEKSQEEAELEAVEGDEESTETTGEVNDAENAPFTETENNGDIPAINGGSSIQGTQETVPENNNSAPVINEGNAGAVNGEGNIEGNIENQEPIFEGSTENVSTTSEESNTENESLFINEGDMLSGIQ